MGVRMSDWHSIATAPKDGTCILLFVEGQPVVAGWYVTRFAPFPWVFVDNPVEAISGCCDKEMAGRVEVNGYPLNLPTH